MTIATTESTITGHEAAQIDRANAARATPVVFVHGLWLLPSSWDRWLTLFEEAGYVGVTPGWPDDPETVAEAREHPEVFAGKGIREIADYEEAIIRRIGRDQPCSFPWRAPAADLGAALGQRRPAQPRELEPRGPAQLRPVPLQLRERGRRGRGEGTVSRLLRPRRRRASLPGGVRELESVVRGEGQLEEPGAGSDADRLGRLGPYGPLGDRERILQEAEAQQERDRDRQDAGPRARADDRRRLAGGRREGARVRQAVHIIDLASTALSRSRRDARSSRLHANRALARRLRLKGRNHMSTWHTTVVAMVDPARPGPEKRHGRIRRRSGGSDRGAGSQGHHDGGPLDGWRRSRALHRPVRHEA